MDWWLSLAILLVAFLVTLFWGVPVAFGFLLIDVVAMFFFWGGTAALDQLVLNIYDSVANFSLLPAPMFILMGEVMFFSGIAPRMIESVDKWIGRMPGRLSLLAVLGGTIFSTLSGSSVSSCAMLGSVLVPEMDQRGYKKPMSIGPILGSAGLAIMIPPSTLGILLAALAKISAGQLMIAIILPGILMAVIYSVYVVVRSFLQPDLAPPYTLPPTPMKDKIKSFAAYVLPLGIIVFLVIGVLFLGVATPTEGAALGAIGCVILAYLYKGLNRQTVMKTMSNTVQVTVMMFMILIGSNAFSQIMAYTGASRGLLQLILGLNIPPIVVLIGMQFIMLIMGCFMETVSIMMVSLPIYMPIIDALGINAIWFGAIMLLNMEMSTITPPFGISLYVMKSVAPKDTNMGDIYRGALPFVYMDLLVMAIMIVIPATVLWLPSVMR